MALELLNLLIKKYPAALLNRYKVEISAESTVETVLEDIGHKGS